MPEPAPVSCVGIIMDGNRRWARERNLPTLAGHEQGYAKLKDVLSWCQERGIKHLIVFGFSTENWNRSKEEVSYLMDLLRDGLARDADELKKKNGRLRIVGQKERFSPEIQKVFAEAEEKTKNGEYTLWLALSYGGRAEILHAASELAREGNTNPSEEDFNAKLWSAGMPDPDIIIRTSGEQRLSGFLPWQGVYAELFFTKTYWPAFSHKEFDAILGEFSERERRHGK
jgi:undecaprenyl diphosphate synthase